MCSRCWTPSSRSRPISRLDDLPTLLELGRRAGDAEVENLVIQPPLITFEGDRGDGRGYILEIDVEAVRAEVQELIGD